MKIRRLLIVLAGLMIASIGLITFIRWSHNQITGEPTFQGKPASYWRKGLSEELFEVRQKGILVEIGLMPEYTYGFMSALESSGVEAVPVLIVLCKDRHPYIRIQAIGYLSKIQPMTDEAIQVLQDLLQDDNQEVRGTAASALKDLQGVGR